MNIREATSEIISLYKRCDDDPSYPYKNVTIFEVLKLCMCEKTKELTLKARSEIPKGKSAYIAAKSKIPCATFSASFEMNKPRWIVNATMTHTIVLDIDHISEMNYTVDEVKQILIKYSSIYWVQCSVSGDGVFALVRIADGIDRQKVFEWFNKDLKEKHNIKLDKLKDATRLRFLAWDESPVYKEEIVPAIQEYEPVVQESPRIVNSVYSTKQHDISHEKVAQAIWKVLNSGYTVNNYGAWYHVGCEFANFSDGEQMFQKLSDNYGKQNDSVLDKYKQCLKKPAPFDGVKIKWLGMAKRIK